MTPNELAKEVIKGSLVQNYEKIPEIIKRIESALKSFAQEKLKECLEKMPKGKGTGMCTKYNDFDSGWNQNLLQCREIINQEIEKSSNKKLRN